jgi:hypothetical protein
VYQFSTVIYSRPARAQKNKQIITLRIQKNCGCPPTLPKTPTPNTKRNLFHVILVLENINTMAASVTATATAHAPLPAQSDVSNPLIASSVTWCLLGLI